MGNLNSKLLPMTIFDISDKTDMHAAKSWQRPNSVCSQAAFHSLNRALTFTYRFTTSNPENIEKAPIISCLQTTYQRYCHV